MLPRRPGLCLLLFALPAAGAAQKAPPLQRPPAVAPSERIPLEPLGFRAPSSFYMSYRIPWATLDFLDDTHLLFTFHANELMRRDKPRGDKEAEDHQDQIARALVLELPSGRVTERASWRLHDRARWLWPLGHGRFLQREARDFYLLDGSLTRKTLYFTSPGPPQDLEVDPNGKQMVVEWRDEKTPPEPSAGIDNNQPALPPSRSHLLLVDLHTNRGSRSAELSHAIELTLAGDGYLRAVPGKGHRWELMDEHFDGEPDKVASVNSACEPELNPIAPGVFLASLCMPFTTDHLVQAWDLTGKKLWEQQWNARFVWGNYGLSAGGTRFAYESLAMDHAITTLDPIDPATAQAQVVGVYTVKDGHLDLVTEADPVLTAGQNYALSDDGERFAVLRGGNIEVYTLPPTSAKP